MNTSYIRHNIKHHFPDHDVDQVLAILSRISTTASGYRPDDLYRAILRLATGDMDALLRWIDRATSDEPGVLRAARNVESWDAVVEFFAKYVRHSPPIDPMLRFVRQVRSTDLARLFLAGTSHDILMISKQAHRGENPAGPFVTVRLEKPPELLRIEYGDSRSGARADPSFTCQEPDALAAIAPLLEKLRT